MTNSASANPPMEIVRDWVEKISALLGVAIQCSEYVKRALFLQHNWSFLVPYSQVTVPEGLVLLTEKLKEQVTEQQDRLRASSDLIRCLQENTEGHSTLRRKRSAKHITPRGISSDSRKLGLIVAPHRWHG